MPLEVRWIDAHLDACLRVSIDFDIGSEFAAVDEMETVDRSLVFGRRFIGQRHKWLIGVTGSATLTVKRVDAADKWGTHNLAFPSPSTRQLDHVKISIREIDGHAQRFVQMDVFSSIVAETC